MAKLYFYYSAMNAGKSTTLLQSDYNYRERGMRTLLFTPRLDDRYGEAKVTSRIGLQADAIAFHPEDDLFVQTRGRHGEQPINCILVDEAQFLSPAQVLLSPSPDHASRSEFELCAVVQAPLARAGASSSLGRFRPCPHNARRSPK